MQINEMYSLCVAYVSLGVRGEKTASAVPLQNGDRWRENTWCVDAKLLKKPHSRAGSGILKEKKRETNYKFIFKIQSTTYMTYNTIHEQF